jgi:hypothetical protein
VIQIVSLVNIFQLQPYKATPEEAMSTDREIQDQARRAIDMFLASVTYPVIWSNGDRIATLGSGVLFQHEERHFLLTARHLFDEYDKRTHTRFPYEGLVGPVDFAKVAPTELGQIFVHSTNGTEAEFLDIVAIELLEGSFVRAIKRFWQFIKVESFALPDLDSPYFVAGFPKVRERQIGENIGASFMSLVTQRLPTVPVEVKKYDARYDLILDYDNKAADFYRGNKPIESPFVGGVSGVPIFRVADKAPEVWAPKSGICFMGLQASSIKTNQWLRIKNMHAI